MSIPLDWDHFTMPYHANRPRCADQKKLVESASAGPQMIQQRVLNSCQVPEAPRAPSCLLLSVLSVCLSVCRSVGPSVRPSVRRSVGPSVRRSVCPSVRLSPSLSLSLSKSIFKASSMSVSQPGHWVLDDQAVSAACCTLRSGSGKKWGVSLFFTVEGMHSI